MLMWAQTAVAGGAEVWPLRALPGAAEDRLSTKARAQGATGESALPACSRAAPEIVLCVMSRRVSGQVAMVDELTAAGLSTDQVIAMAGRHLETAWSATPARTFTVDGVAGRYFVRAAGDGFDAAALLRPELLAELAGAVPVVAVPEDGTVVWWVPGDPDFDKMVAVGVRRMVEASDSPVSSRIYRHTGTEWSTWGEVRGNIELPQPVPAGPGASGAP